MNRDIRLLGVPKRHARTNLPNKPLPEFFCGLKYTAADDQRVWIERIDHFVEE